MTQKLLLFSLRNAYMIWMYLHLFSLLANSIPFFCKFYMFLFKNPPSLLNLLNVQKCRVTIAVTLWKWCSFPCNYQLLVAPVRGGTYEPCCNWDVLILWETCAYNHRHFESMGAGAFSCPENRISLSNQLSGEIVYFG